MGFSFNNINVQSRFWTIPGPFLICSILLAIILRASATPIILPITAVCGFAACLIWKWRGVALSSVALAAALVYCLQMYPSQSWVWIIALSLTIASSYVVSVLCSEEAYHDWEALNKDAIDHKQTLSHLNERYQAIQSKHVIEQNELTSQIAELQKQIAVKEEKQRSNEKLIKLARHEMTETFAKQEKLLQELQHGRQRNASLEAKLTELEELVDPEMAKNYGKAAVQSLEDRLKRSSQEVQEHAALINKIESEKQDLKKSLLQLQEELEMAAMHEVEKSAQNEKELAQAQAALKAMEENEAQLKAQAAQHKLTLGTSQASFKENEHMYLQQISQLQTMLNAIQEVGEENEMKFKEEIEHLQSALKQVQEEFEENEYKYNHQLEQHKIALNKVHRDFQESEEKLKEHIEHLQSSSSGIHIGYQENEQKLKDQVAEKELALKDLEALHLETQDELKEHMKSLESLHRNYEDQTSKIAELEGQLESNLANIDLHNDAIALLRTEKEALNMQLAQLVQVQSKQPEVAEVVEAVPVVQVVQDNKEIRRIEGLYQQLRQQFSEKSETLSATRRELFATQEQLLTLQKEHEEAAIDSGNETIESLHRVIAAAESELALLEHQHALEITRLHEVIDSLMAHA